MSDDQIANFLSEIDKLSEFRPKKREEIRFDVPDPPIVSLYHHKGLLFVATERRVYVRGEDNILRPLVFQEAKE